MKSLRKGIKQIDLFGVELSLNIRQQNTYKSQCGGIMSLLMIILLSYITIAGLIGIIKKENYTIKIQSLQTNEPNYSIMNIDNFMMAVNVQDPFKVFFPTMNKTAFNITIDQMVIYTLINGTKVKSVQQSFQLETCTEKHFNKINFQDQQQIKNQLSSYFCLPMSYQIYLEGNYNSDIFYYPKLKVQLCTGEGCYSAEEREQVKLNITALTLSTIIQSNIFVSNRDENFFQSYINSDFYLETEYNIQKRADLFFKYNKIIVDDNVFGITTNKQEDNFWSFQLLDYREQQVQIQYYKILTQNPDILFQLNFRLHSEADLITKTASKLDQFLSYIGGMLKFFTSIFGLVAIQYNMLAMKLSLANSLYQFNIPKRNKEGYTEFSYDKLLRYIQLQINHADELLNRLKTKTANILRLGNVTRIWNTASGRLKLQKLSNQSNCEIQVYDQKILLNSGGSTQNLMDYKENFLHQLISKILDSRKQLKLGMNFFIYVLMCCSFVEKIRTTRLLIGQCNQMIQKELDIVNILSKVQQIEKLKSVILDREQISVFDYIPKPVVNLGKQQQIEKLDFHHSNCIIEQENQNKSRVISKLKRYNKPKKFLKIYDSYLKLKNNNTKVNERLIQMLGSTIEKIFQKYNEIQEISPKKEDQKQTNDLEENNQKIEEPDLLATVQKNSNEPIFNYIQPKAINDEEIKFQ